jgi:uncharacterized protein (DUF983 family)
MLNERDLPRVSGHRALRTLLRRCPNCGAAGVFRSYLHHRASCPACGLRLDRGEPDFFIGAYTLNLIVAELVAVGAAFAVGAATWPDVPWTALMYGVAVLIILTPIMFYPFSKQAWLALDLFFRPAGASDFVSVNPAGVTTSRGA